MLQTDEKIFAEAVKIGYNILAAGIELPSIQFFELEFFNLVQNLFQNGIP